MALPTVVQDLLFENPEYGNADCLTREGLLALAGLGKDAWNAWRECFPVLDRSDFNAENGINNVDFSGEDFRELNISFAGFKFGDGARFDHTKWGDYSSFEATEWGSGSSFSNAEWGSNTRFIGATWGEGSDFESAKWAEKCDFTDASWGDDCDFTAASWGDECKFAWGRWGENISFTKSVWGNSCNFECASWGKADFIQCIWGDSASFAFARFGALTNFRDSYWDGLTIFDGAQFCGDVYFQCTEWRGDVSFLGLSWGQGQKYFLDKNWQFDQGRFEKRKKLSEELDAAPDEFLRISFNGARFSGKVDFSNRRFLQKTSFASFECMRVKHDKNGQLELKNGKPVLEPDPDRSRNTIFTEPPIFHGCELHQDTSFYAAKFPPASGIEGSARSYGTLKLHYINQQNVREEQRFFRLEMAEETKQAGRSRGLYWLYGQSSDYGFSLWRPVVLFVLVVLVFAQVYGLYDNSMQSCWPGEAACEIQREWLNFSLAQSMPLPGFDNLKRFEGNFSETVPICFVAINKVLAFILFFLAGLALRNLFRLK